jgi:peptidoglycan/LPS O-acetylase OafA/YrhL
MLEELQTVNAAPPVRQSPPLASIRLTFLDGVRGLAIIFVLLVHCDVLISPASTLEYVAKKALAPLWIGVDVFFVLSGFLITGILMDTKNGRHYFRSFYVRRILRIFPLYFVALAAAFVILPAFHVLPATPFSEQAWFWSYLVNWRAAFGHGIPGIDHFWSLAIEEQFYLVWPFLIYFIPNRRIPLLVIITAGGSIVFRVLMVFLGEPIRYAYFMTPARLDDLAFGALAAYVVRESGLCKRFAPWITRTAVVSACIFATAAIVGKGFEPNKVPAIVFGTIPIAVLTSLLIIFCVANPAKSLGTRRFLGTPLLAWMGRYSYGIYVFHLAVIAWAQAASDHINWGGGMGAHVLRTAVVAAAAIGSSCLLAFLSYHVIERHFLHLKARFAPN